MRQDLYSKAFRFAQSKGLKTVLLVFLIGSIATSYIRQNQNGEGEYYLHSHQFFAGVHSAAIYQRWLSYIRFP